MNMSQTTGIKRRKLLKIIAAGGSAAAFIQWHGVSAFSSADTQTSIQGFSASVSGIAQFPPSRKKRLVSLKSLS